MMTAWHVLFVWALFAMQPTTATDPCASAPCQNGGSCISIPNGGGVLEYQCLCAAGRGGRTCDVCGYGYSGDSCQHQSGFTLTQLPGPTFNDSAGIRLTGVGIAYNSYNVSNATGVVIVGGYNFQTTVASPAIYRVTLDRLLADNITTGYFQYVYQQAEFALQFPGFIRTPNYYLIVGGQLGNFPGTQMTNAVWRSADLTHWTLINNSNLTARASPVLYFQGSRLWLFGGQTAGSFLIQDTQPRQAFDWYYSDDEGLTWIYNGLLTNYSLVHNVSQALGFYAVNMLTRDTILSVFGTPDPDQFTVAANNYNLVILRNASDPFEALFWDKRNVSYTPASTCCVPVSGTYSNESLLAFVPTQITQTIPGDTQISSQHLGIYVSESYGFNWHLLANVTFAVAQDLAAIPFTLQSSDGPHTFIMRARRDASSSSLENELFKLVPACNCKSTELCNATTLACYNSTCATDNGGCAIGEICTDIANGGGVTCSCPGVAQCPVGQTCTTFVKCGSPFMCLVCAPHLPNGANTLKPFYQDAVFYAAFVCCVLLPLFLPVPF